MRIFAKPSRKTLNKLYKKEWQGSNLFILPHKPKKITPEKSVVIHDDDPPEYTKPIYDKHGNLIGVLYDPPMSGLTL